MSLIKSPFILKKGLNKHLGEILIFKSHTLLDKCRLSHDHRSIELVKIKYKLLSLQSHFSVIGTLNFKAILYPAVPT